MGGNSQIDNSPGVVPFRLSVANYNYSVNVVDNINLRSTVFGCELPATYELLSNRRIEKGGITCPDGCME